MVRYPIIAIFDYKDKTIKVSIPIRIKKIILKIFTCKKCRTEGTTTQFKKHYTKEYERQGGVLIFDDSKRDKYIQKHFDSSKGTFLCPTCKKLCKPDEKILYKMYISHSLIFIDVEKLITYNLLQYRGFRWKSEKGHVSARTENVVMYIQTFEEVYEYLNDVFLTLNKVKKTKKVKCQLKLCEKVTKRQFNKIYKDAELEKIARKI